MWKWTPPGSAGHGYRRPSGRGCAGVQAARDGAIKNAGFPYPRKRLTVNLAPASVRKEGPSYDLPIALACWSAWK